MGTTRPRWLWRPRKIHDMRTWLNSAISNLDTYLVTLEVWSRVNRLKTHYIIRHELSFHDSLCIFLQEMNSALLDDFKVRGLELNGVHEQQPGHRHECPEPALQVEHHDRPSEDPQLWGVPCLGRPGIQADPAGRGHHAESDGGQPRTGQGTA